eukprot:scaffold3722_cov263-Pinguiococcus_pyrenoidosus.AAC.2
MNPGALHGSRLRGAVLPNVHVSLVGNDGIHVGHAGEEGIAAHDLVLQGAPDGVAERQAVVPGGVLSFRVVAFLVVALQRHFRHCRGGICVRTLVIQRNDQSVIASPLDVPQARHVHISSLHAIAGQRLHERHAVQALFAADEAVDQGALDVAPDVIRPNVGKVDVRIHRQGQPQPAAIPRDAADPLSRHLERSQVVAPRRVELDFGDPALVAIAISAFLGPGQREHRAGDVPVALRQLHPRVDEHGIRVVHVATHHDPAPSIGHAKSWGPGVRLAAGAVVPVHGHDLGGGIVLGQVLDGVLGDGADAVSFSVVQLQAALLVAGREENVLPVRTPLHVAQTHVELSAPQAVAVDAADDHVTVFVHDADLEAIGSPLHALDHTAVAVVDHLLVPHVLLQHPHNDQAVLVRSGELLVLRVPDHAFHSSLVALERLVHTETAGRGHTAHQRPAAVRHTIQLQHFQNARVAATRDPALLRVPVDAVQRGAFRHRDLFA